LEAKVEEMEEKKKKEVEAKVKRIQRKWDSTDQRTRS